MCAVGQPANTRGMDDQARLRLVLGVCIPLRLALVALSYWYGLEGARGPTQAALGAAIALGFAANQLLRATGARPQTGFGGGAVYWHSWAHALLFAAFAAAAAQRLPWAWALLLLDVLYGLATVLAHYYA
jgi:hypothetical protein